MAITKENLDELLKDYQNPKTCLDKAVCSSSSPRGCQNFCVHKNSDTLGNTPTLSPRRQTEPGAQDNDSHLRLCEPLG